MFLASAESRAVCLRRDVRITRKSLSYTELNRVEIDSRRGNFSSCEFHSSGEYILSGTVGGEIHIRDTDGCSGKLALLKGHTDYVNETRFSRDGSEIYSGSFDESIGIWDSMRGCRKTSITSHMGDVTTVQCTRSQPSLLVSGSMDTTIQLWDLRQRKCAAKTNTGNYVMAACFSKCGNYVFSGGNHCGIDVRDIRVTGEQCLVGRGPCAEVTGVSLSPCGNYLAVCDVNGLLKWDASELIRHPNGLTRYFHKSRRAQPCCAWSADGSMLTACNSQIDVLVINSRSAQTVRRLEPHGCVINGIAFHPHKRVLMSAGDGLVLQEF